jgi:hypothetical protein
MASQSGFIDHGRGWVPFFPLIHPGRARRQSAFAGNRGWR